jgi:hypothetical protein
MDPGKCRSSRTLTLPSADDLSGLVVVVGAGNVGQSPDMCVVDTYIIKVPQSSIACAFLLRLQWIAFIALCLAA